MMSTSHGVPYALIVQLLATRVVLLALVRNSSPRTVLDRASSPRTILDRAPTISTEPRSRRSVSVPRGYLLSQHSLVYAPVTDRP